MHPITDDVLIGSSEIATVFTLIFASHDGLFFALFGLQLKMSNYSSTPIYTCIPIQVSSRAKKERLQYISKNKCL